MNKSEEIKFSQGIIYLGCIGREMSKGNARENQFLSKMFPSLNESLRKCKKRKKKKATLKVSL